MVKHKVHMTAFGDCAIREVPIAREDLEGEKLLEAIFFFGQNDFDPQPLPSVSAGDVIFVNDQYWLIVPIGFKLMTKEEFDEYCTLPRRDRLLQYF